MHAVIELAGKQFRVATGDSVFIDGTYEGKLTPRVLMVGEGAKIVAGADAAKATVEATADGTTKKDLGRAMKFKPKQGGSSKRTLGHRRVMTRVRIGAIKNGA